MKVVIPEYIHKKLEYYNLLEDYIQCIFLTNKKYDSLCGDVNNKFGFIPTSALKNNMYGDRTVTEMIDSFIKLKENTDSDDIKIIIDKIIKLYTGIIKQSFVELSGNFTANLFDCFLYTSRRIDIMDEIVYSNHKYFKAIHYILIGVNFYKFDEISKVSKLNEEKICDWLNFIYDVILEDGRF